MQASMQPISLIKVICMNAILMAMHTQEKRHPFYTKVYPYFNLTAIDSYFALCY
jgi:hypothetical protein